MTPEEVDALEGGDLYHYLLDKDHNEWARVINRQAKFELSADQEEMLGVWLASAMMAPIDRPNAGYIRARLDAEKAEDAANANANT